MKSIMPAVLVLVVAIAAGFAVRLYAPVDAATGTRVGSGLIVLTLVIVALMSTRRYRQSRNRPPSDRG